MCRVVVGILMIMASFAAPHIVRASEGKAVTAGNPQVATDELELMIKPLTKSELAVEAEAWLGLLKEKVTRITEKDLEVKAIDRAVAELEQPEGSTESPSDASTDEKPTDKKNTGDAESLAKKKEALLETLTTLRDERAAIANRVNLVLDGLGGKGGDTEEHRAYVTAVSDAAPKVDVADVGASWIMLRGWLTSKEGGIRWGLNILKFIVAIVVFSILGRIASRATGKAMDVAGTRSDILKSFLVKLVGRTVFFVGLIVALSLLEVPISPFLAVIGGAALVIGLALQGTLSNFASGIMILIHHPFDVGDVINAAGTTGKVESMSVLSTELRTFDNQRMVVPNNSIWGDVITNVTGLPTRRVDLTFGIGYEDDIAKAQSILEQIVKSHEQVLDEPAPTIRLHELADSSVNFIVRPWSKTADYWNVYWDITREVKERFDAEGISIPFPQRDVHVYSTTEAQPVA